LRLLSQFAAAAAAHPNKMAPFLQGKKLEKVRENEKMVPPDVRFSG